MLSSQYLEDQGKEAIEEEEEEKDQEAEPSSRHDHESEPSPVESDSVEEVD